MDVIRAIEVVPAGTWSLDDAADHLLLCYDDRYRRRFKYVSDGGAEYMLDLARTTLLREGDGLRLEDGRIVAVHAAREALVEATAPAAAMLLRFAWHLGNRHLVAQLDIDRILIRDDPVIVDMLRGLGAIVRPVRAAFSPELGAYSGGGHHHDH